VGLPAVARPQAGAPAGPFALSAPRKPGPGCERAFLFDCRFVRGSVKHALAFVAEGFGGSGHRDPTGRGKVRACLGPFVFGLYERVRGRQVARYVVATLVWSLGPARDTLGRRV
jgi:hypothetical protein